MRLTQGGDGKDIEMAIEQLFKQALASNDGYQWAMMAAGSE